MKENSRTENTIRNVSTGFSVQFVNKLMSFVVRTVFVAMLNSEYLGINGLFTNILTMLSFTELGIGTAIIFSMYKPIEEEDIEKLKSLMHLYKIAYIIIGFVIFGLGLCVIPFMDFIITDAPNIKESITFIYILFLFNTASSYFFTYKKSIIIAYQKQSIINNIDSIFYVVKSILEIIVLWLTRNYIVYLMISILTTFLENIYLAYTANKMYPFITEKNFKPLEKNERDGIFSNVKSLVVYKFGQVILSGTDNIIMSAMINISTVGLCSNYTLIIQAVKSVVSSAFEGVTASVGNLNTSNDTSKEEKVFYQMTFAYFVVYTFIAVCFAALLNPFIEIWLGKDYLLSLSVAVALSISTYIEGVRLPGYIFRTTLGLFKKGKIAPYIGAVVNIVMSILLCKVMGVTGIFVATSIAQLASYTWIDPYLIHKYEFKTSVSRYTKKYIMYFIIFIMELSLTLFIVNIISFNGLLAAFILKMGIAGILPSLINLVLFYRTEEFKALMDKFISPLIYRIKSKLN